MNGLFQQMYPIEATGSYLILLPKNDVEAGIRELREITGATNIARTTDSKDGALDSSREEADILVLSNLGVAITELEPDQLQMVSAASQDKSKPILVVEPEQVFYAIQDARSHQIDIQKLALKDEISLDYLRGYRDAIAHLVDGLVAPIKQDDGTRSLIDLQATWGLQVTKAINSQFSGRGVKVAILDTGFDFNHPDFQGRTIVNKSFVKIRTNDPFLPVQDGNGHGTHCTGTACGSLRPSVLPRYGIAYEAEIYIGKVLADNGRSVGRGAILQGMEWAIANGCKIISMSLGGPVNLGQPFSQVYEDVAKRAMQQGTLIIAAAGNGSRIKREAGLPPNPVWSPANCPSIMAVGAIDSQLRIAPFSDGGMNQDGGEVNIAAPGVDIYSSWLASRGNPPGYLRENGTSMATPHVAGIAALYAQANSGISAQNLFNLLLSTARPLSLPARDVGAGLVQAP